MLNGHTLAELGSHDELLRKKGIYYGLVTARLSMGRVNRDKEQKTAV